MDNEITQQEREQYAYTAVRDIDNTFIPNCSSDRLSLNQIFLILRHGLFKADDLPAGVRARYDEALPYLRKRFHRG